MLEVSNSDISSLNLSSQNQNGMEELNIINDTVKKLKICKNYYADIYGNVSTCFQNYLRSATDVVQSFVEKKKARWPRLNLNSNIDLKNEPNTREICQTFTRFLFAFRRFPTINKLMIVSTGNVPSSVLSSDIVSPSKLYKRYNSGNTRGLVCIHFLAALNVHLGGDKMISKNAISEFFRFFHNLSMQGLSISDDTIVI